jgi:hypothetical protein
MARKSHEVAQLKLRLPEHMRRRVEKASKAHRRSMNAEINERLRLSFTKEDQEGAQLKIATAAAYRVRNGGPNMSDAVLDAVRELVDAVLTEHCLPTDTEGVWNEQHTIRCTLEVLRKICDTQDLSSLHDWAATRLVVHAGDVATDEAMAEMARFLQRLQRGLDHGDDDGRA